MRPIVLDVRDGRTRTPLTGVTADAAHVLWQRGGWGHLRAPQERIGSGDSPLTLERKLGPNEYLPIVVEAPGYAPVWIELFEAAHPAESTALAAAIELQPPGDLELEIADAPDHESTEIRLVWLEPIRHRTAGGPWSTVATAAQIADHGRRLELLVRGPDPTRPLDLDYVRLLRSPTPFQSWPIRARRRLHFRGLPAGAWGLLLRARFDGVAFDVGAAAFHVEPGTTARATIRGRTSIDLPPVPVTGTITVDRAWSPSSSGPPLTARLECVELDTAAGAAETPPDREAPLVAKSDATRLCFDFGAVWPGSYVVRVAPFAASHAIVVRREGGAHDFAIAPPAEVELTLHLEGSSQPFDRARVAWSPSDVREEPHHRSLDDRLGVAPDDATGRFSFHAPAARIRVVVSPIHEDPDTIGGVAFEVHEREFDLVPGRNELSMELPRRAVTVLILRDGMRNVAFAEGASVDVESEGEPVDVEQGRTNQANCALTLPRPGRYRITVSGIDGFETAAVDVELRRARELVVIPLRRAGTGGLSASAP